jgi:hypothetical protein
MKTSDFMSGAWGQHDTDIYILTVGRQSRSTFVISKRLPLQHSQCDMVGTRHNHADRAANIRVGPTRQTLPDKILTGWSLRESYCLSLLEQSGGLLDRRSSIALS